MPEQLTVEKFCLGLLATLNQYGMKTISLRRGELDDKFSRVAIAVNERIEHRLPGYAMLPPLHAGLGRERTTYPQLFDTLRTDRGRQAAAYCNKTGSYRFVMTLEMETSCLRGLSQDTLDLLCELAETFICTPTRVRA
jgi:hypothetical protein